MKKNYLKLRRIIQLICFILVPSLFIEVFNSIKAVIMCIVHHEQSVMVIIPNIVILGVVSLVTILAGRFFCGWMCAFGAISDFLYRIPRLGKKNPKQYLKKADPFLKLIKYIVLAFVVVFMWVMQIVSLPLGVNPLEAFGMMVSFSEPSVWLSSLKGAIPATIILLAILVGCGFVERFFCRYLCPVGAYFSLISRLKMLKINKKRETCNGCSLCTRKCSMGINLTKHDKVNSGECIQCMECVRVCPKNNAKLAIDDNSVNGLAAGAVACTVIAGAYYLGNIYEPPKSNTQVNAASDVLETSDGKYKDGVYSGSGKGFRGTINVDVTVESGVITDIEIVSSSDDKNYIDRASSVIINSIISKQGTEDVDAVSGATYSSKGIITAVSNALTGAQKDVTQTPSDNKASSDTKTESSNSATQKTEASSSATQKTEQNTTESAANNSSLADIKDGVYTGSGTGFRGTTNVSVTVSGGRITAITVNSYQDDEQFFKNAESKVIQSIISEQSVEVDAVSGATYSSNSIKAAVADALNVSYTAPAQSDIPNKKGHKK